MTTHPAVRKKGPYAAPWERFSLPLEAATKPIELHVAVLAAWMIWPDDDKRRRERIQVAMLEERLGAEAGSLVPVPDPLKDVAEQFRRGLLTGLSIARAVARNGGGLSFSIANAQKLMDKILWGDRESSSSHVRKVWKTYRPVAALWAAAAIVNRVSGSSSFAAIAGAMGSSQHLRLWLPCDSSRLPRLLACAEAIRERAETVIPARSHYPILARRESLQLPTGFSALLPRIEIAVG
jgi:hypothetical protein